MAQLSKGTVYADGDQVTFSNLNALVDNGSLRAGAIDDQFAASGVNDSDNLLLTQSGTLKKATVSQFKSNLNYLKPDGSVPMATGQQLTLGSTSQLAPLDAVSLGYLQDKYLKNTATTQNVNGTLAFQTGGLTLANSTSLALTSGASINLTSGSNITLATGAILTLGQAPATSLQAATKDYVDTSVTGVFKAKAMFSGVGTTSISVTGTYIKPASGSSEVTVTMSVSHGLKVNQRVYLNCSGTLNDSIYTVLSVPNSTQFTFFADDTAVTTQTNCEFKKAVIHSSTNVDSIIFASNSATGGAYIVNLTNSYTDGMFSPVITCASGPDYVGSLANIASLDRNSSTLVARTVNSFVFTGLNLSTSPAITYDQLGYRSGLVVF